MFDPLAAWTYDNPYLPLPSNATTIEGMQRVRALKDIEVRVGDVWAQREIGKIALGRKIDTEMLMKGRLYA